MSLEWLEVHEFKRRVGRYPHEIIADFIREYLLEFDENAEVAVLCDGSKCHIAAWLYWSPDIEAPKTIIAICVVCDSFRIPRYVYVGVSAIRIAEWYPCYGVYMVREFTLENLEKKPEHARIVVKDLLRDILPHAYRAPFVSMAFGRSAVEGTLRMALDVISPSFSHFLYKPKASKWILAQLSVM